MAAILQELADTGVAIWLDDLIASVTGQLEKAGAEVSASGSVSPINREGHAHPAAQASASPA